jgi:TRAP-type C4-dicarboxylate transport system substrate-binding protein
MKLRTISKYAILAEKYGASPMNIPAPDLYTSVQQGLVDGFFMSFAAMDLGLGEVTKYYIDPGFGCSDEIFFMNLKKWNSIPSEMKTLITEEVNAVEKEWEAKWDAQYNIQKERAAKQGVKVIKLFPKEGERFVSTYTDLVWQDVIKRAPEDGKKLRKLCGLPPL